MLILCLPVKTPGRATEGEVYDLSACWRVCPPCIYVVAGQALAELGIVLYMYCPYAINISSNSSSRSYIYMMSGCFHDFLSNAREHSERTATHTYTPLQASTVHVLRFQIYRYTVNYACIQTRYNTQACTCTEDTNTGIDRLLPEHIHQ